MVEKDTCEVHENSVLSFPFSVNLKLLQKLRVYLKNKYLRTTARHAPFYQILSLNFILFNFPMCKSDS